ncbi:MAG: sulfatase-like hydrolase/transferase [Bacilli bacterium]
MKKYFIGQFRPCDLLTMFGTIMAFIGMIMAINNHFTISIICLMICGICDGFDGTLARRHNYSESQKVYGSELDSLSDVISFGAFPAILTYLISNNIYAGLICIIYLMCGVIRLTYFNMLNITKEGKKGTFVGIPITTVAIVYPLVFLIIRFINFELLKWVMPGVLLLLSIFFVLKISIPKPDVVKILKKIFNKYVVNFIVFPLFIVLASDIFFRLNNSFNIFSTSFFSTMHHHFLPFIFVWIIFIVLCILLNAIFNDSKKSKIFLLVVITILLVINDIKYTIMGNPIVFSDINFLNADNINMMGTAVGSIGIWIIKTIIKAIVMFALGFVFIIFDKYCNFRFKSVYLRILAICLSFIFITILFIHNNNLDKFTIEKIYNTSSNEIIGMQDVNGLFNEYGFFQAMYLDGISNTDFAPEGYNKSNTDEIIEKTVENIEEEEKWEKANVVFILSEAFFDVENISEVVYNKNLTSNIDKLEEDGDAIVFDLLVPVYGGCSVNSEFEILTGMPTSFWKSGYIPYNQYYINQNSKSAPNIIKEFNNNDYTTMYLTPWGKTSYNSEYVYSIFGATEKKYGDSLNGEIKGLYYSDMSLMKDIYNELQDTETGDYKFIMSATAQNHFTYNEDKYNKYDISIKKTKLSDEATGMLKSYAQGVYDADKSLYYLYNKIQELDVPTIVVFFGDHLPYLVDSQGTNILNSSSYVQELFDIRMYTTKGIIFSNYDTEFEDLDFLKINYLGAYIINNMDLEISDYFKYINEMRKEIPLFDRNKIYDSEINSFVSIEDARKDLQNLLTNYKYVQYRYFYDY